MGGWRVEVRIRGGADDNFSQLHCFQFWLRMFALTFGSTLKTEMCHCDVITEDSRRYHVFVTISITTGD